MRRLGATGLLTGLGLAVVATAALTTAGTDAGRAPRARPAAAVATGLGGYSNIHAVDYVGPARCGECHKKRYRQWRGNLHRAMNTRAGADDVLGDFSGVRLAYADGVASFDRIGAALFMTLQRKGQVSRRFRVTRTIGSRYLQEYVGIMVEGPEPRGHRLYATEIRLPFGYWLRQKRWFHHQYFDSWFGPEYAADGSPTINAYAPDDTPWATRCAWCHNTYPFEFRALRSDRKGIGHGPAQFFSLVRHELPPERAAAITRDNHLPVDQLVTVGISCESCHLGGREHAVNDRDISFVPASPGLVRRPGAPELSGGRDNNLVVNAVCGQCHSTPAPDYPDGGATRASREVLDLAASPCVSAAKCTDCHDPHVKGPGGGAAVQERHVKACVRCHANYSTEDAARRHSRHAPSSATCLDCHMPKQVQGLSHVIRSHRIGSPTSVAMLAAGAPNACNLCHLDKSIRWTLNELEHGWNRYIQPLAGWQKHYGAGLAMPVGRAWLESGRAADRIAAAAAYARTGRVAWALPRLLDVLDDPVAHDRMWILFAIEDLLRRPLTSSEYEPRAAPSVRATQITRLRSHLPKPHPSRSSEPLRPATTRPTR